MAERVIEMDYEFEERAAILEYDGGMTRQDAELKAKIEILRRSVKGDNRRFGMSTKAKE